MARRGRKDSTHEKSAIVRQAIEGIEPPAHIDLPDDARPFWAAIIDARAEWTDSDLALAAELAICQYDMQRHRRRLQEEGDIIKNDRGTKIVNPRHNLLETMSRRAVALSRLLQVHAAATLGETKLQKGKNEEKAKALNTAKQINKNNFDDLIPGLQRPVH